MRSATSKTSLRLCEMTSTATPRPASVLIRFEHHRRLRDAERGGRLVHDHQLGLRHHRLGDRDRLALAAGQRRDRLADRAHGRHVELLQRLARGDLHRRLVEQPVAERLVAEEHVLDDVQVVAQREVLVDRRDARAPRRPGARGGGRGVPSHRISPPSGRPQPGDGLDQRRLAGAVVADERRDLARRDLEVDVGQRPHRAERLGDPAQLEQRPAAARCRCAGGLGDWDERSEMLIVLAVLGDRARPLQCGRARCTVQSLIDQLEVRLIPAFLQAAA